MGAVLNILVIVVIMAILVLAARFLMRFGVKEDVTVYSPQGEMATLSKAEARHRVTQGWTLTRSSMTAPSPCHRMLHRVTS